MIVAEELSVEHRVFDYLKEREIQAHRRMIALGIGENIKNIENALCKLKKKGKIFSPERGYWKVSEKWKN